MNTIPQPAPLSEHAEVMQEIFTLVDRGIDEHYLDNPEFKLSAEIRLVLAALDAFADEQQPAPRGTEEAE